MDQGATASAVNLDIAPIINQTQKPLIISNASHSFLLALSYVVDDQVKFNLLSSEELDQWKRKVNLLELRKEFSDIFLYYPKDDLLNFFQQSKDFKLIEADGEKYPNRKVFYKVVDVE
ncbi:MAG: hypothetical protein F6K24_54840 [Okeania sp. SIO2D1]|nr:hypothetical protein [Okeania sp. SIO2D1]